MDQSPIYTAPSYSIPIPQGSSREQPAGTHMGFWERQGLIQHKVGARRGAAPELPPSKQGLQTPGGGTGTCGGDAKASPGPAQAGVFAHGARCQPCPHLCQHHAAVPGRLHNTPGVKELAAPTSASGQPQGGDRAPAPELPARLHSSIYTANSWHMSPGKGGGRGPLFGLDLGKGEKQEQRIGGGKGTAINQRAANKAGGEKPQPAAKRY